jgi:NAD(P)H-flavin reductase
MNIMKTHVILVLTIGLFSINSCKQDTDPNAVLENSEIRTELFYSIASNHDYVSEFMNSMQENKHAMQMIQGNKKMIKMMHEKGMMSEVCMQSCMKMMHEKDNEQNSVPKIE